MKLQWPRIRAVPALLWLAWILSGSMMQAFTSLPEASGGHTLHFLSYVAGSLGVWVAIPVVQLATGLCHELTLRRHSVWRWFPAVMLVNALCFSVFLLVKLLAARALRVGLATVLGLPGADLLSWDDELRYEFPKDMVHYSWLFAAWLAFRLYMRERQEAERAARLETMLVQSRLEALNARLDPHFIYNALNTLNSLMHVDLKRTEHLFDDLGGLLRAVLSEDRPTWSLAEERQHTQRYVDFVEARFGDRVQIRWSLQPELEPLPLPRFCLLSLVENAVKHNQRELQLLCIELRVERRAGRVVLEVSDDGVGFGASPQLATARKGGLERLAETLQLLYGERAVLTRGQREPSGARVTLELPEA